MSRRTKPKDPFRGVRRRVVNHQLGIRVRERAESMYKLLAAKHALPQLGRGDVTTTGMTDARAREIAVDFATSNRAARRRKFRERGDGHLAPFTATMKIPKGRKRA